ncbi:MAG TPA: GNAT family N-acetyltransferase [Gaiellaceae bacterium]|nr:GNAT family N-acetyltransferase [Gaiellaceae bacterium]
MTPPRLELRAPMQADAEAITELVVTCDIEELGEPDFELDDLLTDWNRPGFDLGGDAVVVTDDETIVAYAALVRRDYADVYVHPGYRGRGIGAELLAWTERRAAEALEPGETIRLGQVVTGAPSGGRSLLERAGYEPVRTYWRMELTFEGPPPPPAWPEGIRVRSFDRERDSRAVHALVQDAFADNERHEAESFEEWQAFMIDREAFEPGLWFIAEADGEIAGAVLCPDYQSEGWVRQLAVGRAWRRRGLGTALLRQAMSEFHRRGRPDIGLVVDSWNRTGAKELYERAGMHVAREHTRLEKELHAPASS